MTLDRQYDTYLKQITTRKRGPAKGATLAAYQSYWKNWIYPFLKEIEVSQIENGTMKRLVAHMAEAGLGASTIAGVTQLLKGIVASAVDENGNELYPRKWNAEFIDAPIISHKEQDAPVITAAAVAGAIQTAPSQYGALFALLAGSGLRISEALGLRLGPNPVGSYWDPFQSKIVVRTALYHGQDQAPKTQAGVREVDLAAELNDYLMGIFGNTKNPQGGEFLRGPGALLFTNEKGGALRSNTVYDEAEKAGVPGFHSFRRFRVTHLENVGVPLGLMNFWVGHSEKGVHSRYVRLDKDLEARKEWAQKAGVGFELPTSIPTAVETAQV